VIDALGRAGLTHDPGTAYAYSNGGYSVLAALVERASGMGYGAFLQERIFGPLGMTSSAHDAPGPTVERRVPGYDPWGVDRLTPAIPVSPAYTTGSGSLWSSATDLLTWNEALHTGKVLSEASYRKLVHDYGHGYGFGVSVFQRFGREVLGHDGRVSGFSSDVARYLEDRVTVVVLGNVQSVARDEIRRGVAAAVFVEPEPDADRPDLAIGWSGSLDELAGTYAFGPGFAVTIRASDGRLLARANQGGESELVPTASGEWFSRMLYATVHFDHDESGRVDALVWGRGERAPIGRRTP
jgi:CubicO group peptidase (beta-lactamase class C family)